MKVIHIESGLGNQMLSYCEYLALKKMNPNDDFYIENIIFDIPECNEVICQWNGYELERIFGIKNPPNIKTLFSDDQWNNIMEDIRGSKFWAKNWNYPVYFTKAFNKAGLNLENIRGDFESNGSQNNVSPKGIKALRYKLTQHWFAEVLKRKLYCFIEDSYIKRFDNKHNIFIESDRDIFTGQWLSLYRRGNGIEQIEDEIRKAFVFPEFTDLQNIQMSCFLDECNSIAVHVRRGDALSINAWIYKSGFFKRAVEFIKKRVDNPVFVFFTDPASKTWVKQNEKIFGLDFNADSVRFVDWNSGSESYRDMQLMTHCKHAVISYSSFGWWGAYLINSPDKITITPMIELVSTHHI